jgi:hypothetical protein
VRIRPVAPASNHQTSQLPPAAPTRRDPHVQDTKAVDVRAPELLLLLVDEDVVVERLAGDMTDLEGPVWHPPGNYLLFSDNDTRRRWDQIDGARALGTFTLCNSHWPRA